MSAVLCALCADPQLVAPAGKLYVRVGLLTQAGAQRYVQQRAT